MLVVGGVSHGFVGLQTCHNLMMDLTTSHLQSGNVEAKYSKDYSDLAGLGNRQGRSCLL